MPDELDCRAERRADGVCVVTVAGEIDLSNAEHLRRALADAVDDSHELLVDLSGVTYLDSAGLAVIFARATATPIELVVSDLVAPVVAVSGLDRVARVNTLDR